VRLITPILEAQPTPARAPRPDPVCDSPSAAEGRPLVSAARPAREGRAADRARPLLLAESPRYRILMWLALSANAIIIDRFVSPTVAQYWEEPVADISKGPFA
jgi:hypothetical protein